MNREDAKNIIKSDLDCRKYLIKSKYGNYICPFCGSGTGPKQSGAVKYYEKTNTCSCFASCAGESGQKGKSFDVIDIIMQQDNCNYNDALEIGANELNITIDSYADAFEDFGQAIESGYKDHQEVVKQSMPLPQGTATNYAEYYKKCAANIEEPAAVSYLMARGISIDTAKAYHLGFDAAWISPTVAKNQAEKGSQWRPAPTARIIMPVTSNYYVARATDANIKQFAKMNETGGGSLGIFNFKAAYSGIEAVFVCEGIFDALSIIEAGEPAIALNSTNNADMFVKQLKERPTDATIIICLDKDKAGKEAADKIKAGCQQLNIDYITADICGTYNDPNEALTGNREEFSAAISRAKALTAARPNNTSFYIDNFMDEDIKNFKSDKKTGFVNLDAKSGGLYPGLYIVAAISSLGKTTLALQIADNVAAAGHDVLFFSMEQNRLEMVSKSLARLTRELHQSQLKGNSTELIPPLTSLDIRQGHSRDIVELAADEYKRRVGERMNIIEGNFNCDISFIGDYIRRYMKRNKCNPLVVIDYLQILTPETEENGRKKTTKDTMDDAVHELERMSKNLGITIIAISSVNRANYLTPISQESIKESGGIEFTADVIWGLQFQCLNEELFGQEKKLKQKRQRINQAKKENPRKIELVCLKNRFGDGVYSVFFDYYAANDCFMVNMGREFEDTDEDPFADQEPIKKKTTGNRI